MGRVGELLGGGRLALDEVEVERLEGGALGFDGADSDVSGDELADDLGDVLPGGELDQAGLDHLKAECFGFAPVVEGKAVAVSPAGEVRPFASEDEPALIQNGYAVAEVLHLDEEVRGEQDSEAAFAIELLDELAHFVDALGIEALGRFIEEDGLWRGDEGLGKGEALAHAVGVHFDGIVNALFQADGADGVFQFAARDVTTVGGEDFEILPAAHVVVEAGCLEDGADFGEGLGAVALDRDTVDEGFAGIRKDLAEENAEGGALAGAIVAEESEDLAALDLEGEIHEGGTLPKGLVEVVDSDHAQRRLGILRVFALDLRSMQFFSPNLFAAVMVPAQSPAAELMKLLQEIGLGKMVAFVLLSQLLTIVAMWLASGMLVQRGATFLRAMQTWLAAIGIGVLAAVASAVILPLAISTGNRVFAPVLAIGAIVLLVIVGYIAAVAKIYEISGGRALAMVVIAWVLSSVFTWVLDLVLVGAVLRSRPEVVKSLQAMVRPTPMPDPRIARERYEMQMQELKRRFEVLEIRRKYLPAGNVKERVEYERERAQYERDLAQARAEAGLR